MVILALFFIGARWADPDDAEALEVAAIRQAAVRSEQPVAPWQPALFAVLALALLALPNLDRLKDVAGQSLATVQVQLPDTLGRWQAVTEPLQDWTPNFPKATASFARGYRSSGAEVTVHVAYYREQQVDRKLVSSVNGFIAGDQPWHVVSQGVASAMVDGQSIGWRRAVLTTSNGSAGDSSRHRLTVWRLYWLGGRLAHGDVEAKLIQAWQAVLGEPDDGVAIHLVSSIPDDHAADQQLTAFVTENFAMLERTLASAKASR